ncbi:hypothetical protein [Candidatus Colwellia aromaticivorans]|uniref:hypothetical protein n=1 Tax=Candidatus Colwellia aromaticivorans TaxID=2267621 RepID=UPI000DF278C7|nr:hypothetical protein [Candidatus Colwellia aromaticivorans]
MKKLRITLLTTSVIVIFIAIYATFSLMDEYNLTFKEFINKSARKLTIIDQDERLVNYPARYSNLVVPHNSGSPTPKLFLKELRFWNGKVSPKFYQERITSLQKNHAGYSINCQSTSINEILNCYLFNAEQFHFKRLENALLNYKFILPKEESEYGNAWHFVMIYDLASASPSFSADIRRALNRKMSTLLTSYLTLLDGEASSLWHGRSSLIANAFLLATMLPKDINLYKKQYARAFGYMSDLYRALSTTEVWPEGYNYWINARAFQLILALSAFSNAQPDEKLQADVKHTIYRIGLWHVYLTRPDTKMEGWGDEGPRIDLKDETAKVIDLIAQITNKIVFRKYSRLIRQKYGKTSYYKGYRWMLPLLWHEPEISDEEISIPTSELFGKNYVNQMSVRSNWSPNATFLSFRSGHLFSHHQHYDAGHFSIFKGAPLALNSSVYNGSTKTKNRLNYSIRTIAKNSLLIQKPDEKVKPNHLFEQNVAGGGQRLSIPTGSSIYSFDNWQQNLYQGMHLEGGELLNYKYEPGVFTSITTDLTNAYNSIRFDESNSGGKVQRVERTLTYLEALDIIFVYDNIRTTSSFFKVKWLLHTINKPEFKHLSLLKGNSNDGILETSANNGIISNGDSTMRIDILSPELSNTHLVGGPNYKFYVEVDGDDSKLDGINMKTSKDLRWFENPEWRMEVSPQQSRMNNHFMIAMQPRIGKLNAKVITPDKTKSSGAQAQLFDNILLVWNMFETRANVVFPRAIKYIAFFSNKKQKVNIKSQGIDLIIDIQLGFNYIKLPKSALYKIAFTLGGKL